MTREKKLERIYEVIANKEESEGCFVLHYNGIDGIRVRLQSPYAERKRSLNVVKVIGHPVMIGDVLDWYRKKENLSRGEIGEFVSRNWGNTRKPIEDQSEECIDFIYSLLGDE